MDSLTVIKIPEHRNLNNDDLPLKEQLALLLKERGGKALVSYAWRCSLRALPLLTAKSAPESVWSKDIVKQIAVIIRANVLPQNMLRDIPDNDVDIFSICSPARAAVARAANSAVSVYSTYAVAYSSAYMVDAISLSVTAEDALLDMADDADTYINAASEAAYDAADAAFAAYDAVFDEDTNSHSVIACLNDFNALVLGDDVQSLIERPLWPEVNEHVRLCQKQFFIEFQKLGLDFLADEIQTLWNGELTDEAVLKRYSEQISVEILDDAKALKAFILGEEIAEENSAVRVMLVGPGGAGKTSLHDLLLTRQTEFIKTATSGVGCNELEPIDLSIHKHALDPNTLHSNLNLYLWDFGGQTIFHNLHRGFMRKENCVYVLVVDSRHEQAPDDWLAQIRLHTGGEQVSVLLVTNCYEAVNRKQNHNRLVREYPELLGKDSFFELSCIHSDEKFDHFLNVLVKTCVESKHLISPAAREAIFRTNLAFENQHFVTSRELKQALKVTGKDKSDEWRRLSKKLDSLGRIIFIGDGKYCLDPDWIVNTAYSVINHTSLIDNAGIVAEETFLDEYLDEDDEPEKLLLFLRKHKAMLSFEKDDESYYFFPDAATASEPIWMTPFFREKVNQNPVTIDYYFDTFPMGLKSHFVTQMLEMKIFNISLPEDVWSDGVFATFIPNGVKLLVEYHLAKQLLRVKLYNHLDIDQMAEPVSKIHAIIERIASSVVPVLSAGFKDLDAKQRSDIFKYVDCYKQVELVKVDVQSIAIGDLQNSVLNIGNDNKIAVSDSYKNNNDAEFLKSFLIEALEFTKKSENQHLEIIAEMQIAIQSNLTTLPESHKAKGIFSKMWDWAKEADTSHEIAFKIAAGLSLIT